VPGAPTSAYWKKWLARWDAQQEAFIPTRERRFHLMLDAVEAAVGRSPRVLDLGSGPGPLSLRVLRRFPRARCVAVDYDPVVMRIGQGALGTYRGRLTWVDAKLGAPGWTDRLPPGRYDAAVSTTALHWLQPRGLSQLYRDLARVLRSGGVFVNGDYLPYGPEHPADERLARRVYRVHQHGVTQAGRWAPWRRWWSDAAKVPALAESFAEHRRRGAEHPKHDTMSMDRQVAALHRAGFRSVTTIYQVLEDRVMVAQR